MKNKQEIIYQANILNVAKKTIDEQAYEYIDHNGAVCVLAFDEFENVILVQQYRYPFKKNTLELVAGKLEASEKVEGKQLLAAKRELAEETGLVSYHWSDLGYLYLDPRLTNEKMYCFVAKQCQKVQQQTLDDGEFVNVMTIPLEQLHEMIIAHKVDDLKTSYLVERYYYERNNQK